MNILNSVTQHTESLTKWQNEIALLRETLLECVLVEAFKWKQPCYTIDNKNVFALSSFKPHCAIIFFKGSLLNDKQKLLTQPTENSEAMRQFRFNSVQDIRKHKKMIKQYLFEAIEIERNNLKVKYIQPSELEITEELKEFFEQDKALKTAFDQLTVGRQKAYLIHFSSAK